ncbi:MAG: aa3-type cytochrome c oxidase subunit IV [Alphaproteobacteria bacterium]|nr:aa3-type cytochrome c oxidase subunit IV [Alphaproteobacteria bacterium]
MATENDSGVMPDQIATYRGLLVLFKWSIAFFVVLLVAMYFGLVAGLPFLALVVVLAGIGGAVFVALSKRR